MPSGVRRDILLTPAAHRFGGDFPQFLNNFQEEAQKKRN
jgi:hypothetical protein